MYKSIKKTRHGEYAPQYSCNVHHSTRNQSIHMQILFLPRIFPLRAILLMTLNHKLLGQRVIRSRVQYLNELSGSKSRQELSSK